MRSFRNVKTHPANAGRSGALCHEDGASMGHTLQCPDGDVNSSESRERVWLSRALRSVRRLKGVADDKVLGTDRGVNSPADRL